RTDLQETYLWWDLQTEFTGHLCKSEHIDQY
ncbi:MAG: hypothetical protein ACI9GB_002908, partial [Halioglobus sp.]